MASCYVRWRVDVACAVDDLPSFSIDALGSQRDLVGLKEPLHGAGKNLDGKATAALHFGKNGGCIISAGLAADVAALGVALVQKPQKGVVALGILSEPV